MMQTQALPFVDMAVEVPCTQGVKYVGSKLKLLPYILDLAKKTRAKSVFDGFSGSTRVSQAFAQTGYRVISNDLAEWSKKFATCYLKNLKQPEEYQSLINHLNSLPPEDGWFTEHYGGDVAPGRGHNAIQDNGTKKPWQKKNTRRLDAIRREIDELALDEISHCVAITSLILALDQVDSTLGHFASYLKDWSPRSFKDLKLQVPMVWRNTADNAVLQGDVFDALAKIEADLAYYDPPYGSNNEKMPPSRVRYASYYHPWTTICKNDRPALFGKALRRKDTSDTMASSVFEEFRKNAQERFIVVEAIDRLLKETPCQWIMLSYSSGGRAAAMELNEVIRNNGELLETVEIDYKRNVMATMKWTNEWVGDARQPNREFIFLIRK